MSKGSKQRPIANKQQFDDNWDKIFGKKENKETHPKYAHWVLGAVYPPQKKPGKDICDNFGRCNCSYEYGCEYTGNQGQYGDH